MKIAGWVLVVWGCFAMIGASKLTETNPTGGTVILVQAAFSVALVVGGIMLIRRKRA